MKVGILRKFIAAISALIAIGIGMFVGTVTTAIIVVMVWGHLYMR